MPTGNILETPELGTPLYNDQNVGSQWWLLLRGSTVDLLKLPNNYQYIWPLIYVLVIMYILLANVLFL